MSKTISLTDNFTVVGTHPVEKLNQTRLFKPQSANVVLVESGALKAVADLHVSVMKELTEEEKSFMLGKSRKDFEALYSNPENGVVGVVHDGNLVAKAHMVCPTAEKPYAWHDGVTPVAEPDQISVTQGVCVASSHRGNEFMVSMLRAWEDHARGLGKTHLVAEAEIKNKHSLENFLSAGFNIHAVAVDATDQTPVFVLAKDLTKRFYADINGYGEVQIVPAQDSEFDRHQRMIEQGYVGVGMTTDYANVLYGRSPMPGLYLAGR